LRGHKQIFLVITVLFVLVAGVSQCMDKNETTPDPRSTAYAGDEKCASCHKNVHDSFIHTAHRATSAAASDSTVKGNFTSPSNEYYYRPAVKVVMEKRDSGLFQVAYQNNEEKRVSRFDIAIGSGRKAQTFLYWDGAAIFQLPVSWSVAANNWVNSPNYPAHQVRFDRAIPVGCFECHGSGIKISGRAQSADRLIDNFDRNSIVYGVTCERCHGPAAKHAAFQEEHPQDKKANFISQYASLQLQQKIDMCAQCHSGLHQTMRSLFRFKPGDTLLDRFFLPTDSIADPKALDVHGNQTQLLQASQCFIKSNALSCTSCHAVHQTERNNMAIFSQRCMSCHNNANHNFCTMAPTIGEGIEKNCIDCHMPSMPSKLITLLSNGQTSPSPNLVRTHFISVYPEASKRFLTK
jgi:hypothetical protein